MIFYNIYLTTLYIICWPNSTRILQVQPTPGSTDPTQLRFIWPAYTILRVELPLSKDTKCVPISWSAKHRMANSRRNSLSGVFLITIVKERRSGRAALQFGPVHMIRALRCKKKHARVFLQQVQWRQMAALPFDRLTCWMLVNAGQTNSVLHVLIELKFDYQTQYMMYPYIITECQSMLNIVCHSYFKARTGVLRIFVNGGFLSGH